MEFFRYNSLKLNIFLHYLFFKNKATPYYFYQFWTYLWCSMFVTTSIYTNITITIYINHLFYFKFNYNCFLWWALQSLIIIITTTNHCHCNIQSQSLLLKLNMHFNNKCWLSIFLSYFWRSDWFFNWVINFNKYIIIIVICIG